MEQNNIQIPEKKIIRQRKNKKQEPTPEPIPEPIPPPPEPTPLPPPELVVPSGTPKVRTPSIKKINSNLKLQERNKAKLEKTLNKQLNILNKKIDTLKGKREAVLTK